MLLCQPMLSSASLWVSAQTTVRKAALRFLWETKSGTSLLLQSLLKKKRGRSNASKREDQTLLKCLVCVEIKKSEESRLRKRNKVTKEVVEIRGEAEEKRDGG